MGISFSPASGIIVIESLEKTKSPDKNPSFSPASGINVIERKRAALNDHLLSSVSVPQAGLMLLKDSVLVFSDIHLSMVSVPQAGLMLLKVGRYLMI